MKKVVMIVAAIVRCYNCGLVAKTKCEEYMCPKCHYHMVTPERCFSCENQFKRS
jgi:DNA-directed RNA polymerase subunit N (RpoN/RPB10)